MSARATTAQAALIRKMIQSHVVTPTEREGFERRLADGFTRGTPHLAIEWLKEEVASRKATEKADAEAAQMEFPDAPRCACGEPISAASLLYSDGTTCDHCAITAKTGRAS